MAKYMLIYRGEATDMSAMTPEQIQETMGAWEAWMGGLGGALLDGGNPFGPATTVVDDGTTGTPADLTGFTIVEAADLDAAAALTNGHPYLSDGKGDYCIDVVELMQM